MFCFGVCVVAVGGLCCGCCCGLCVLPAAFCCFVCDCLLLLLCDGVCGCSDDCVCGFLLGLCLHVIFGLFVFWGVLVFCRFFLCSCFVSLCSVSPSVLV